MCPPSATASRKWGGEVAREALKQAHVALSVASRAPPASRGGHRQLKVVCGTGRPGASRSGASSPDLDDGEGGMAAGMYMLPARRRVRGDKRSRGPAGPWRRAPARGRPARRGKRRRRAPARRSPAVRCKLTMVGAAGSSAPLGAGRCACTGRLGLVAVAPYLPGRSWIGRGGPWRLRWEVAARISR